MIGAERLFFLLGEVDDAFMEEAAQSAAAVPKRAFHWQRWAALAACAVLAVGLVRILPLFGGMGSAATDEAVNSSGEAAPNTSAAPGAETPRDEAPQDGEPSYGLPDTDPGDSGGLPVLTATPQFTEGAGGSGIWTDDVTGYISNALVFDGASPDTLPVYTSTVPRDEHGDPLSTDEEAMEALLSDILFRFGLTPNDCTLTSLGLGIAGKDDIPGYLEAVTPDGTKITVNYQLIANVTLPLDDLPQTLHSPDTSSRDSLLSFGEALIDELDWLLGMDAPVPVITGGDVNLYGETQFYLTIRDGGASDPTSPIAYSIGVVNNRLILWLDSRAGHELLGEYPIITQNEAVNQLLTGSWVGYDGKYFVIPTAEQILRSELVYCTNVDGYTMPYYRFYLDLGETVELCDPDSKLSIGATVPWISLYHIPAVEPQYLSPGSAPAGNQ